MKLRWILLLLNVGILMGIALARNSIIHASKQQSSLPVAQVDLKAPDGTLLKATYFAAGKPGPGVLLFHQSNRTRESWESVAKELAAAGINTLTFDYLGHGESGGIDKWNDPDKDKARVMDKWTGSLDAALQYLVSQPGVARDDIGMAGAGLLGVDNSVEAARRHPAQVKSLALLSGETFGEDLEFLRQSRQLPGLFVVSDDDEYPPTQAAMPLLYASSSSPYKKLVHYVKSQDAPWLWYEPFDIGKVAATGGHGTDLFKVHPDLPGIIVHWFVTTLIKTPGHAPVDPGTAAPIIADLEFGGGVARVRQELLEARKSDPQAQLFPEASLDIIGSDFLRKAEDDKKAGHTQEAEAEIKSAIEIFKLNVLAYPDSADAHDNLAWAYLTDGQKDLAREYAQKALTMVDSHAAPLSSWSDTEERRGVVRKDIQGTLKKLGEGH